MNLNTRTMPCTSSSLSKKMPDSSRRVTWTRLVVHLEFWLFRERYSVTKKFLLFAALLLLPMIGRSQVEPAGRGGNEQFYVGATFSSFDPDYGWQRLYGIGTYADYNLSPKLGIEGEARFQR